MAMTKRVKGKSAPELVTLAKADGVKDAYGFAEWLVQGEDYYNLDWKTEDLSEMEQAYEDAMGMFNGHTLGYRF